MPNIYITLKHKRDTTINIIAVPAFQQKLIITAPKEFNKIKTLLKYSYTYWKLETYQIYT